MFKNIKLKLYSAWFYLFKGLKRADNIIGGNKEESLNSGIGVEEQQESNNVLQDLLNRRLTQDVKDLRYSASHAERNSYNYDVDGSFAKKKTGAAKYKGKAENSEGYTILVDQNNRITNASFNKEEYKITLGFDFITKFKTSSYVEKLVIKEKGSIFQCDIYFSKYLIPYNNVHKFFISELKKLISSNYRSELTELKTVSFNTFKCFGYPDGVFLKYEIINYLTIVEYDGFYILKFNAKLVEEKDSIDEVFDEISHRKYVNKERRESYKPHIETLEEISEQKKRNEEYIEKIREIIIE